ncbi:MAG TPA: FecR domain-containing protein [Kofleriaceae bacterium]
MNPELDRIVIDVPAADSSRHRVEPRMFDRLDAIRAAERAKDVAPDRSARRWPWIAVAAAITAAAAITIILATHGRESTRPSAPSLVVTPAGGSSRFTIDDAVIDAGSDTSVAVQSGDHGAVTLVLARGTIDCEVAPRNGRPFHVIAGDVDVEVVGTRFAVTRGTSVRVDVTHGRVRVRAPNGDWMVGAGERWPVAAAPTQTATVDPTPAPVVTEPETHEAPKRDAPTAHDLFLAAQAREARDWAGAAKAYRATASGDDRWAALALYSLAELDASHDRATPALAALDEYRQRFPRGASAEDAAWLRIETLRVLGRADDVRAAAADYVKRFPSGTYIKSAARLATPP